MGKFDKMPDYLAHRPIVGVEKYYMYDGFRAFNTDAAVISVGIAQWDDDEEEISAKVFRHNGERWSRQSEELPLHRCFDLCNLIIQAIGLSENLELSKGIEFRPTYINEDMLKAIKTFYEATDNESLILKMKNLRNLLNEFFQTEDQLG